MKKWLCVYGIGMMLLSGCAVHEEVMAEQASVMEEVQEVSEEQSQETSEGEKDANLESVSFESSATEQEGAVTEQQMQELFMRYPDEYGWMDEHYYGDIPELANADYIVKSLADGCFFVSTPEELAAYNYYVNVSDGGQGMYMELQKDIDLAGYEWAPMGWSSGGMDYDLAFTGVINGNGHTIYNMTMDCRQFNVGFIGWGTTCSVYDLTIADASVNGENYVGILCGQAIGGSYEDCHVSGETSGNDMVGSMLGYTSSYQVFDCTSDVLVNGESFPFLSWNDREKSEIVIENPVTIVLHDDHTVTRPPVQGYDNLGWLIKKDGVQVLHRNAEDELYYQYAGSDSGVYTICLTAFVDGQYVPVSNVVEYTIE